MSDDGEGEDAALKNASFCMNFFGLCCIFVMDLVQWVCVKKERWKNGKGRDGIKPP